MSAPEAVTATLLATMPLPFPAGETDKDDRGRVLAVGGSAEAPGGILLAGEAALRAGAGKLQLGVPEGVAPGLGWIMPEARVFALPQTAAGEIAPAAAARLAEPFARSDSVVLGPGAIDGEAAAGLAARLLALEPGPALLLDAAAMHGLMGQAELTRRHAGRMVITPHAGEMATLMGIEKAQVEADPVAVARQAAAALRAVVVMKGRVTFVVSPDGAAWRHDDGVVGLAASGSGDVLAGIVGGLLARGAAPVQAALWGVFLHGQAGVRLSARRGPLGFLTRELAAEVPALLAELSP